MEGSPSAVGNNNEENKEEKRKAQLKKPEHLGILAVEPASEKEPELSPLEKVIAAIRRPAPETEEKPAAEEEPVVLPETEPPVERVPEEDARRIVHEMVRVEQQPETEEEPAPASEIEPVEVPEAEPPKPEPESEAEPVPVPEVEPEIMQPETAKEEPAEIPEVEPAAPVIQERAPESEPPPAAEIESGPEPEPEPEPEPKLEAVEKPKPIEIPAEKPETPPDEDDKKPGFIKSLFRRRGKDKTEKEPDEVEETVGQEPEEPASIIEKDEPEGPEFRFTEKTEEPIVKPEAVEAPEEPEAPRETEARPEHIGQMLLNVEEVEVERPFQPAAEAPASSKAAEEKMKVESSPIEPASGKRIDTLSRAELMELGETIEVNGSNLRHIYETHLIGERGLRRLVAEHVRGGDLAKALRREVMEHEMDFERDPVMRDLAVPTAEPVKSSHTALDKLLQEADVTMSGQGEQTAFSKASTKYQAASSRQRQSRQYRVLDVALVAMISILALLVILVLLTR